MHYIYFMCICACLHRLMCTTGIQEPVEAGRGCQSYPHPSRNLAFLSYIQELILFLVEVLVD